MEARIVQCVVLAGSFFSLGASARSPNFVVTAPTVAIAKKAAEVAERHRVTLAREWLGHKLPNWYQPCRLTVRVGQLGAGGYTKFQFERSEVFDWRMMVQGSMDRIVDSVIPHEVSHTVFACHFRRPLPRWADEGAATLAEDRLEQRRQLDLLERTLRLKKEIPLRHLLLMTEYPAQPERVYRLYAQGFSLTHFLVQQGGRQRFLKFIDTAHRFGWDKAIQSHYQHKSVELLEQRWRGWVLAGSPQLDPPADVLANTVDDSLTARDELRLANEQRSRGLRTGSMEEVTLKATEGEPTPMPNAPALSRQGKSFDEASRELANQGFRRVPKSALRNRR
ncbi:MAG: peptidase MA family metallohydrolase [Planctomycetota bacterium]|nr:peptidase MA family metallohydrolase [Planctomycetota bacterium]